MKVARAIVSFIDGSYLFVELAQKVAATDTILVCERVVGLPQGVPADKPSIASSMMQLGSTDCVELLIPLSRFNGINIQEEFLAKQVSKDIEDMWKPAGGGAPRKKPGM